MSRDMKIRILKRFLIIAIAIIIIYYFIDYYNGINKIIDLVYYYNLTSTKKVDWHDRAAMKSDRLKIGLGEQGVASYLPKNASFKEPIPFTLNGFNAHLSDMISLTRSVPDIRNPICNTIKYLSELPSVSVIIPFYNEHWSVLLRSIYSILHRSPPKLIHEIIIVDDFSDKDFLGKKFYNFVSKNLPKVKIIRHKERKGLIVARLSGAKIAKGEVLVFSDAHVEPNYNWLPPLLEPIAYNPKIVVCPLIDSIDVNTFKYEAQDNGALGLFDWEFGYYRIPFLTDDLMDPIKPYRSPVMKGSFISINRNWFWKLGGFDPELDIWGGEQIELSFKIWMCGGELLESPCSRVAHLFRVNGILENPRKTNFIHRNYKRVAEVWMDDYADYVYDRNLASYEEIDAGNLTDRREIRKRLNCKSFNWYMKNIAFDVFKYYPPVEPKSYASGTIGLMANKTLCLDTLNHEIGESPGLHQCTSIYPEFGLGNQNWELSWYKELRLHDRGICLAVSQHQYGQIFLYKCHKGQGNQLWYYDPYNKLLKHGQYEEYCMEADITNSAVYMNKCSNSNINMKWKFGFYNATGLENFHKVIPKPWNKNGKLKIKILT